MEASIHVALYVQFCIMVQQTAYFNIKNDGMENFKIMDSFVRLTVIDKQVNE